MKNRLSKKLGQKGQSAIEFMIVVVVVFFFLLFYLSFSITLVASEYVDYATFMAARTYKSGNIDKDLQEQRAREVFNQYLDPLVDSKIIRNLSLEFSPNNVPNQTEGVFANYQVDMFYLPPIFITKDPTPVSRLTLSSQSLLGRDPSLDDCTGFFQSFADRFNLGISDKRFINWMDDNGC